MRSPYDTLLYWIEERQRIHLAKTIGLPKPWTKDTILQSYRFCNVRREDDTETIWIAEHWRTPYATDPDLWFAMVVARLFNWHPTLQALGYPVPFNEVKMSHTLTKLRLEGEKVFSGAYIVSTNGHAMDKCAYLLERVLRPLWAERKAIRPTERDTLDSFHLRLSSHNGLGSFMAAQVVADLKYVAPLKHALDWKTWASSGPGSRRGLNRVLGLDVKAPWKEREWRAQLAELQGQVEYDLRPGIAPPHAQDLQNCLCEFDKYMRTALGEGRPRSTYPGTT